MEVTSLRARSSRSVIGCKNARTVRSPSAVSTVTSCPYRSRTCRTQSVILSLPESKKSSGTAKGAISRSAVRRRLSAKAQLSAAPRIRTDTLPAVKPDTPSPPRAAARSAAAVKATAQGNALPQSSVVIPGRSRFSHCCSAA